MALIDDFKTRFPEFDSGTVDAYLPALEPVWPCYYAGTYQAGCEQEIILNLVAHLLVGETQGGSGASGPVASRSVGSVSESYAAPESATGQFWRSTKYGQRFIQLTSANYGALPV